MEKKVERSTSISPHCLSCGQSHAGVRDLTWHRALGHRPAREAFCRLLPPLIRVMAVMSPTVHFQGRALPTQPLGPRRNAAGPTHRARIPVPWGVGPLARLECASKLATALSICQIGGYASGEGHIADMRPNRKL